MRPPGSRRVPLQLTALAMCFLLFDASMTARAQEVPAGAKASERPADAKPLGFTFATGAAELRAEREALAVPTPSSARKWLATLTTEPHVAGTPADHKTALHVRDQLREWGWKAEIEEFEVLLNYPSAKPSLKLRRPDAQVLNLEEKPLAIDASSASSAAFSGFHGYGVSGDAYGQVVYVNYGRAEDFSALEKLGISIKGKIVLARYGGNFRGLKVLEAQRRGAAGILIYSDPADDGYAKGDVYPEGPYRPGSAIQRGSVQFLSLGPGDPSTPRGPSRKGAERLPIDPLFGFPLDSPTRISTPGKVEEWERQTGLKRADYFATIPSLPISYDTARELFKVIAGLNVPAGWQGGLPLAYHVGPGPAEVEFSLSMEYKVRPIWNVIATIPGSVEPERWIMVGNHRDAWVYGAVDPGSGTAATLEMCRAIGAAVKNGWKPRRTLKYASWDAEEYGLVGSTEWAEEHAKEINEKAVLMLNVDSAVSGAELDMGGVPSLLHLALDAAASITDIRTGRTLASIWTEGKRKAWAVSSPLILIDPLWEIASAERKSGDATPTHRDDRGRGFEPQLHPLGSGSDYTVFLDHLAVPALDIGFSGRYGVYHSIYDDFHWMEKHGDPEFLTHTQAARLYTLIIMRAAAADVLPFRFAPYGEALRDHVDELRLARARQARAASTVAENAGKAAMDESGGFDGLSALVAAVVEFRAEARLLDAALVSLGVRDGVTAARLGALNDAITSVERSFLLDGGLPGRSWFRHSIYAPGVTTGYGAWPLPALREAVEAKDARKLTAAVPSTAACIHKAASAIRRARELATEAAKSP